MFGNFIFILVLAVIVALISIIVIFFVHRKKTNPLYAILPVMKLLVREPVQDIQHPFRINETFEVPTFTYVPFVTSPVSKLLLRASAQKIPRHIFQTNENFKVTTSMGGAISSWIKMNPEYEHRYFNATDRRFFIKYNFSDDVLNCYDILTPGAWNSDIIRYCYLYKNGGIYSD